MAPRKGTRLVDWGDGVLRLEGFRKVKSPVTGKTHLVDADMPAFLVRASWTKADWDRHKASQARAAEREAQRVLQAEQERKAQRAALGVEERKPRIRKRDIADKYIHLKVDKNPYKKKTSRRYTQFEMLMRCGRVSEFLRNGGRKGAVNRAVRKNYIELVDKPPEKGQRITETPREEPKRRSRKRRKTR